MRYCVLGLCLCLLSYVTSPVLAMSVEEAYEAIPHKQTTYAASRSSLPAADARYLASFFALTDQATRIRVMTLQTMYHGKGPMTAAQYDEASGRILSMFDLLSPPPELQKMQNYVFAAIKAQRDFYHHWEAQRGSAAYEQTKNNMAADPRVQGAHKALLAAYGELMRIYPNEAQVNKTAFFDHLCALDFI